MSNTTSTESEKIDELDPSGSSPEETEKEDLSDTKINLEERAARRLALLALTDSNQYECDSSGTWIDQSGSKLLPVSPSSLPLLATLHRELRKGLESNSDSGPKISNKPSSFPSLQHCNFFLSKPSKPDTESAKTQEDTPGDKIVTVLEPSECHSAQSWPQFPAFSGDSSDWLAFKSAYLDIKTESKTDLLEILKEALTDKAKECVSEMLLANAEPDNIMAVLEQRFGSESLIVKQMANLQALPQASMQNLCQFTAKVNSCLVNIKTLLGNEPLYNTEIYGTIVKKLDAELLNRWFEYVDTVDNDKLPIVVSLNEFLVQQAYALRYLAAAAVSKQSSMPRGTGDFNVTSRSGQCGATDSMSALYQSCFNVTIELGIELSRQLDLWLSKADLTHGPARAIIAPHAGYSYSGACAAFAYRQISPVVVKRIFILGPSHHVRLGGCALSSLDKYETPLYPLTIDKQIYSELEATRQFEWMDVQTDEDEHSIEMHLPYIAKVMEEYKTGFTIIPILVGSLTPEKEAKYGAILAPYLADPQNLVVVSSDFCHWGQRFRYTWRDSSKTPIYQSIEWLDKQGMDIIEKMDPRAFTEYLNKYGNTICGRHPIGVLMQAVTKLQSSSEAPRMALKFLKYAQSSQCMNMSDSSVSYASASLVFE